MATNSPVPTLSTAGWVRSPREKIDYLLSDYYASDKKQTTLYGSNVTSLAWTIADKGNNMSGLKTAITNELQNYLNRYYVSVIIEVDISPIDPDESASKMNINLAIVLTDADGEQFSVVDKLRFFDGKLKKLTSANENDPAA